MVLRNVCKEYSLLVFTTQHAVPLLSRLHKLFVFSYLMRFPSESIFLSGAFIAILKCIRKCQAKKKKEKKRRHRNETAKHVFSSVFSATKFMRIVNYLGSIVWQNRTNRKCILFVCSCVRVCVFDLIRKCKPFVCRSHSLCTDASF